MVAIGDCDGNVGSLLQTLQSASLVDADGKWIGGPDAPGVTADRVEGPFADLLNRLQAQAENTHGGVHMLVGPESGGADQRHALPARCLLRVGIGSEAALRDHGVWRVVVGHGDGNFGIMPRYHGKLIVNDDPQRQGCLVIEYGKPYAMYPAKAGLAGGRWAGRQDTVGR